MADAPPAGLPDLPSLPTVEDLPPELQGTAREIGEEVDRVSAFYRLKNPTFRREVVIGSAAASMALVSIRSSRIVMARNVVGGTAAVGLATWPGLTSYVESLMPEAVKQQFR